MNFSDSIRNNVYLRDYTSLGVGGCASLFISVTDKNEIPEIVKYAKDNSLEMLILGEGSNIVVSDGGFNGLVLKMEIKGTEIIEEDSEFVTVRVSAGENWDNWVEKTVSNGWWGIENMSLIPGTVGACPVQNVGAYGQECKKVIKDVHVFDTVNNEWSIISNKSCNFGFRTSIFNTVDKDRYVIVAVDFILSKHEKPCLSRPEIKRNIKENMPLQESIRLAVISSRTNGKALPKPNTYGSAGTFFRTAIVDKKEVISIVFKTLSNLGIKTALMILLFGWKYRSKEGFRLPSRMLIDACGVKDVQFGATSIYKTNSAVIATDLTLDPSSEDILKIVSLVRTKVYHLTGVRIPIEPTLIGFKKEDISKIFDVS